MAKRKNTKQDETLVDIVDAKESAQDFIESNQSTILGGLLALVLFLGGAFWYTNFYKAPMEKEAAELMRTAQEYFEQDSFSLALKNPSGAAGFISISEDYSSTAAGNAALYYAGICWLRLGEYDAAISYLKDFDATGDLLPITKYGALGDAYSELGNMDEAKSSYQKAINAGDNEILVAFYIKKLGLLAEKEGRFADAAEAYEKIKKEYPNSAEARDIDKFILRVGAKL
jgi:tetratricopeptide (TPR) repeat protein